MELPPPADRRKKTTVVAIIMALEHDIPKYLRSMHPEEVDKVLTIQYRDLFNPKHLYRITPIDVIQESRHYAKGAKVHYNVHTASFSQYFPATHTKLYQINPKVLIVREITSRQSMQAGYQGVDYGFPGGKVECGECESDGLVREVYEETGLSITVDFERQRSLREKYGLQLPLYEVHRNPYRDIFYHIIGY